MSSRSDSVSSLEKGSIPASSLLTCSNANLRDEDNVTSDGILGISVSLRIPVSEIVECNVVNIRFELEVKRLIYRNVVNACYVLDNYIFSE